MLKIAKKTPEKEKFAKILQKMAEISGSRQKRLKIAESRKKLPETAKFGKVANSRQK